MKYWIEVNGDTISYVDDKEMILRYMSIDSFLNSLRSGEEWHESKYFVSVDGIHTERPISSVINGKVIKDVSIKRTMFSVNSLSGTSLELCTFLEEASWRTSIFKYMLKDLFIYQLDRNLTGIWTPHGVYYVLYCIWNIVAVYRCNGSYVIRVRDSEIFLDGKYISGSGWYYEKGVSKSEAMREALFECSM